MGQRRGGLLVTPGDWKPTPERTPLSAEGVSPGVAPRVDPALRGLGSSLEEQ